MFTNADRQSHVTFSLPQLAIPFLLFTSLHCLNLQDTNLCSEEKTNQQSNLKMKLS